MLSSQFLLAIGLSRGAPLPPVPQIPKMQVDCKGEPLPQCPAGWTGRLCDLPCAGGDVCDYALHCHSHGDTYGISTFRAYLFDMQPDWPDWLIHGLLRLFIVHHPADLGLAPGISAKDLGLHPAAAFRSGAGGLTLFRFDQKYRGLPLFGPDEVVTLVANNVGVVSARGAIVDAREDYAHVLLPASPAAGEASILSQASTWSGKPVGALEVRDLRLVAFTRARALGWAAAVVDGLHNHVATVVVEADPSLEVLPLLFLSADASEGLADTTKVTVTAEDPSTNIVDPPAEVHAPDELLDGTDLLGSMVGQDFQLATERIVAYDATGTEGLDFTELTPVTSPVASFSAAPGTSLFRAQNAFVALSNAYQWTDQFMAGHWESTVGGLTPPGEFAPRLHVLMNAPSVGAPGRFTQFSEQGNAPQLPEAFIQPLDLPGTANEGMGRVQMPAPVLPEGSGGVTATLLHEFGHFVDAFAKPGVIDQTYGCFGDPNCQASCLEDSTDESGPLKETWAQIAAIWYLSSLYTMGEDFEACGLTSAVSTGARKRPHNPSCLDEDEPFSLFLRDLDVEDDPCPASAVCNQLSPDYPKCLTVCDKPSGPGFEEFPANSGVFFPTGICLINEGYKTDSVFQAFWELFHARECSLDWPYTCAPLANLAASDPTRSIGAALLFALRVDSANYRGFFDDFATHVACNELPAVYAEVNGVLCHHDLRACDAPVPLECCGNGVRENLEACDESDLGGQSCLSLGYTDGALACAADCTLDESECVTTVPTTGETGEPTSGASSGTSASSSAGESSSSDASAGTGGGGDDGCACQSSDAAPPAAGLAAWLLLALRRRRRAVAGAALFVSLGGCGERRIPDSDTEVTTGPTTSTGESEDTGSQSTGDEAIDDRFFGAFYLDYALGWKNDDPTVGIAWSQMEIRRDGTIVYHRMRCEVELETLELSWTHDPVENSIYLSPNDGDRIKLGPCTFGVIHVALGDDCNDLIVTFIDGVACQDGTGRYLPGLLCAEPSGEECVTEIMWCAEEPIPACQLP